MDLSKYTDRGKRLATYITNRPFIYQPMIWMFNKLALIIGFLCILLKLIQDRRDK